MKIKTFLSRFDDDDDNTTRLYNDNVRNIEITTIKINKTGFIRRDKTIFMRFFHRNLSKNKITWNSFYHIMDRF